MNNKVINLAIISPQRDAISETFIKAHKQLPFNVKFYYGGYFPNNLEGEKSIFEFSFLEKLYFKFFNNKNITRKAISRSFKKEKINCILAEYGPTACEILGLAKEMSIPMVVHFHGFDASNPDILMQYSLAYKEVFDYASSIIVVSKKMKADLIKLGCNKDKIIITPCGPSPDFLKLTPNFNELQFISVARFVEVKGYLYTIFSFKKILTKHPTSKLFCLGDGPQLETCKQFVKMLNLEKSVFFKGATSHEDIKIAMSKSFAFLQHSVTLSNGLTEGAPVSVMEAMAAALPVVCSASGGITDLVIENETGFLIDETDTDSMSEKMCRLIEDKSLAMRMGEAGRKKILSDLSLENHLSKIATEIKLAVLNTRKK